MSLFIQNVARFIRWPLKDELALYSLGSEHHPNTVGMSVNSSARLAGEGV